MTGSDPEGLPERGGTAGALAGLAEGFVRDWVTNAVILLSLIVVGSGVMAGDLPWVAIGPVVGAAGAVVGFLSIAKRWPVPRTWLALLVVLGVDVLLLVLILR